MEYLAVGLFSEDFLGSRSTTLNNPQEIADFLSREFKCYPDQILLIENGPRERAGSGSCPNVVQHWCAGDDYEID